MNINIGRCHSLFNVWDATFTLKHFLLYLTPLFFSDEEEADGEELFGDNMEQDYRPMPGLDRYDPDMLDDDPDNDLG